MQVGGTPISRKVNVHGFVGRNILVRGSREELAPVAIFRIHVFAQPGDCQALFISLHVEPPRYHGAVTELLASDRPAEQHQTDGPPTSSTGPVSEAAAGPAAAAGAET